MSRIVRHAAAAFAMMLSIAAAQAHKGKVHGARPSEPVATETLSLGTDGLCAGLGYHNLNTADHVILGLSGDGVDAQGPPRGLMKQWTATDACQVRSVWSGDVGLQYGSHIAEDSAAPYFSVGYSYSFGAVSVRIEAGAFYKGLDVKRSAHPQTVNALGFFPFAAFEFQGRF